jgi:hypothetical protein
MSCRINRIIHVTHVCHAIRIIHVQAIKKDPHGVRNPGICRDKKGWLISQPS